jgi:hypothetical protein
LSCFTLRLTLRVDAIVGGIELHEERGCDNLSNVPKVTELRSGDAELWSDPGSFLPCFAAGWDAKGGRDDGYKGEAAWVRGRGSPLLLGLRVV